MATPDDDDASDGEQSPLRTKRAARARRGLEAAKERARGLFGKKENRPAGASTPVAKSTPRAKSPQGAAKDNDDDDNDDDGVDDGEDDDDGEDREDAGASAELVPNKREKTTDEQEEHSWLMMGLTEPARPTFAPPSAAVEAGLYCVPRSGPRSTGFLASALSLSTSTALFRDRDAADGLHVEAMPHMSARAQHRHAERLGATEGSEFTPPSKVRRITAGVVRRQGDPVRHVRVRPTHPGMASAVELKHVRPSRHLVDAASRASTQPHTLQVAIGLLQLHDHPYFREEHTLQVTPRSASDGRGGPFKSHRLTADALHVTLTGLRCPFPFARSAGCARSPSSSGSCISERRSTSADGA